MTTRRIRMLKDMYNFGVSYDLAMYEAGKSYVMASHLALQYLNLGYAIEDKLIDPPSEVK